jgi:hypothetical protein
LATMTGTVPSHCNVALAPCDSSHDTHSLRSAGGLVDLKA